MFYEALLLVCLVTPINGWIGDKDTGPTCIRAVELANFPTIGQCKFWLQQGRMAAKTRKEIQKIKAMLNGNNSGEVGYRLTGKCIAKVFDEPLTCRDCEL